MKKIIYILLVIGLLFVAIEFFSHRASQDLILAEKIGDLLKQGEERVDLAELTSFEWDQVAVFGPYTSKEEMDATMGIRFKGDNGGIEMLDDRFLLVFAHKKHAVKTVVLSREFGSHRYVTEGNQFLIVE